MPILTGTPIGTRPAVRIVLLATEIRPFKEIDGKFIGWCECIWQYHNDGSKEIKYIYRERCVVHPMPAMSQTSTGHRPAQTKNGQPKHKGAYKPRTKDAKPRRRPKI